MCRKMENFEGDAEWRERRREENGKSKRGEMVEEWRKIGTQTSQIFFLFLFPLFFFFLLERHTSSLVHDVCLGYSLAVPGLTGIRNDGYSLLQVVKILSRDLTWKIGYPTLRIPDNHGSGYGYLVALTYYF